MMESHRPSLRHHRLLLLLPFLGATGEEMLHEGAVLAHVFVEEGMVWAWPLEQLVEVIEGASIGARSAFHSAVAMSEPPCPF